MKAKWMTALMIAVFSGVLAVGTVASAGGMGSSGTMGHEKTEGTTGYGNTGKMGFSKLDQNGDERISQQEADANPTLAEQFKRLDNDSNGKLDQGEFSRFETMERGTGGTMDQDEGGMW